MSTVNCITLSGQYKAIPKGDLILRPAAFAIIVSQGQLLTLTLQASGRYHLPGGGVETGDSLTSTLIREVAEETGVDIEVGPLVHFAELFFYYNPSGRAYHGLHFYYHCWPKSLSLLADDQVQDGSAGQPRWRSLESLEATDFQNEGQAILDICQSV